MNTLWIVLAYLVGTVGNYILGYMSGMDGNSGPRRLFGFVLDMGVIYTLLSLFDAH